MRTQRTGSATFLMLFVMGITAVIGVFGLPQFEPVVASPNEPATTSERWSDDISSYQQAGAGESVAQGVEDLFAPNEASADTTSAVDNGGFASLDLDRLEEEAAGERQIVDLIGSSPKSEAAAIGVGQGHATVASAQGDRTESSFPESRRQQPTASPVPSALATESSTDFDTRFGRGRLRHPAVAGATGVSASGKAGVNRPARGGSAASLGVAEGEPLNWRGAVARLNSLGIRKYRLTPGTQPDEFHFSCFFSPTENPRVTHRFEAEANEPLQAVQKVLAQVDEWRRMR